jgi:hypothetical protein
MNKKGLRNSKRNNIRTQHDDFVIEMITQHYLMDEGKVERVKA